MFFPLLQMTGAGGSQTLMSVVPFILIIAIFYFFIIRPQNKKQKETQKMIDALKKGDKVVIVKVDENVKIEFNRSAISGVVNENPAQPKSDKKPAESSDSEKAE